MLREVPVYPILEGFVFDDQLYTDKLVTKGVKEGPKKILLTSL